MGRDAISRKAWQRATNALLWYPDNKVEYESLLDELLTPDPEPSGVSVKPVHKDPTAAAAVRLASSKRFQTLKQEIEAVELAVSSLQPEQVEVVRRRFWESKRYSGGRRKPRQFDYLQDLGYSIIGMRKITRKVVVSVAGYLGEK